MRRAPIHRRSRTRVDPCARARGFVLLAVLVLVAAAILIATGGIFAARSATASSRASLADAALRGAALDGVAVAADMLAAERGAILAGGRSAFDEREDDVERLLFERVDGDERIEVVLVRMPSGGSLEPEGAKLPIAWLDEVAAARLASALGSDAAVETLLAALRAAPEATSVDGIVERLPEGERAAALRTLLGPLRTIVPLEEDRDTPPLVSLVGVHARETLVDPAGTPRLDVIGALGLAEGDGTATERSEAALDRFDDAEIEAFEQAARKAGAEPDDAELAQALLARGVELARRDEILSGATLHAGAIAPARLDLVRAPRAVLEAFAAREGLSDGFAERVETVRATLEDGERSGTAWLVDRRVVSAEEHARIAGRITSRSTAWRCRVVARQVVRGADDDDFDDASSVAEEPARGAIAVLDAIIEIGADEPRIVFLRDVSLLDTARALAVARIDTRRATSDETGASEASDAEVASESAFSPEMVRSSDTGDSGSDGFPSETRPATLDVPRPPARGTIDPFGRDVGGSDATHR
ncbi:MAG: hypothetical protein LW806_03185 [Planctomycetaceae bacterium]|nr:hypothetical protein [Planctomycetaceae bacterium]